MKVLDHIIQPPATERDLIRLVTKLWDIECGHLLGAISTQEYRQSISAMLQGGADAAAADSAFRPS